MHSARPSWWAGGTRRSAGNKEAGQRTEYLRPPKDSRQRQPRRRGFDDDNFYGNTPSPPTFPSFAVPASSAPQLQATVKWYNPDKGFGFVELADGSGDVFLHANALQASGFQQVGQGATLQVRVGQGQKGRQVEQVVAVDESTATPGRSAGPRSGSSSGGPAGGGYGGAGGSGEGGFRSPRPPRPPMDTGPGVEMTGTVKWYDPNKGFGFISPQDGSKDVFVHATALERAGHPPLTEGQSVRVVVGQGQKGPEVRSIVGD